MASRPRNTFATLMGLCVECVSRLFEQHTASRAGSSRWLCVSNALSVSLSLCLSVTVSVCLVSICLFVSVSLSLSPSLPLPPSLPPSLSLCLCLCLWSLPLPLSLARARACALPCGCRLSCAAATTRWRTSTRAPSTARHALARRSATRALRRQRNIRSDCLSRRTGRRNIALVTVALVA
jgi:hypothetical protein